MPNIRYESFTEARRVLSGPLKFGDPDQIRARGLIEQAEVLAGVIRLCQHHKFTVMIRCDECQGEGCVECREIGTVSGLCSCLSGHDSDLIWEAFRITGLEVPDIAL